MTRLHDLYEQQGQSPWLDNLRRDWLHDGQLAQLVADGVRGMTSNPTIFAKAIEGEDDYDEQFEPGPGGHGGGGVLGAGRRRTSRRRWACSAPCTTRAAGSDGFVSLEVAPSLAHDTEGTVASGRALHQRIDRPNLLVKVPATKEGVPAIRRLIGEGRSINVTLIFGLERYDEVIEAYLSGLEDYVAAGATDLSDVHSVASFFVSRVDTEVDRRLETAGRRAPTDGDQAVLALRGRAAVAQAQVAYQHFLAAFAGPRWEALAAKGATGPAAAVGLDLDQESRPTPTCSTSTR